MATLAEALSVLDAYRAELLTLQVNEQESAILTPFSGSFSAFRSPIANVMATGVGVRVRGGEILDEEIVLKVYVYEKLDLGENTPEITSQAFQGVPIDVETLPIQVPLPAKKDQTKTVSVPTAGTTPDQHQEKIRPAIGGIEISPTSKAYVGTLGCLVRQGSSGTGALFILSNNHVLANVNQLPIGSEFAQPLSSRSSNVIGRLSEFEPIRFPSSGAPVSNVMDAAIASVTDQTAVATGKIFGVANDFVAWSVTDRCRGW